MLRSSLLALLVAVALVSAGSVAQDPKKDDPKAAKKDDTGKADPAVKLKGVLPQYWGKIGLTDEQKQEVYKIQAKHNAEIEKLEAKIREHRASRDKEMKALLTVDQKKALQDLILEKAK